MAERRKACFSVWFALKPSQAPNSKHKAAVCPESELGCFISMVLHPPLPAPCPFSVFITKVPKKLSVSENWDGCTFKPALSAIDDHGFWGGPVGKPSGQSCPSTTVYRRKEKIEIDLWHWYKGWVRQGKVFSCHSFSHTKCQLISIRPQPGYLLGKSPVPHSEPGLYFPMLGQSGSQQNPP